MTTATTKFGLLEDRNYAQLPLHSQNLEGYRHLISFDQYLIYNCATIIQKYCFETEFLSIP